MRWTNVLILALLVSGSYWTAAFIRGACQKLLWRWVCYVAVLGSMGFAFIRSDIRIVGGEGFAALALALLINGSVKKFGKAAGGRVARRPREREAER